MQMFPSAQDLSPDFLHGKWKETGKFWVPHSSADTFNRHFEDHLPKTGIGFTIGTYFLSNSFLVSNLIN